MAAAAVLASLGLGFYQVGDKSWGGWCFDPLQLAPFPPHHATAGQELAAAAAPACQGGPGCFSGVGWHPPPLPLPYPSATAVQEHGAAQPLVELPPVRPGEHELLQLNKEHSFLSEDLGRQGLLHLCTKSHTGRHVHARVPAPLSPTLELHAADRSASDPSWLQMIVQRCLYLVVLGFLVSHTCCQPAQTGCRGAACWPVPLFRSSHAPTTGRVRLRAALAVRYLPFAPPLLLSCCRPATTVCERCDVVAGFQRLSSARPAVLHNERGRQGRLGVRADTGHSAGPRGNQERRRRPGPPGSCHGLRRCTWRAEARSARPLFHADFQNNNNIPGRSSMHFPFETAYRGACPFGSGGSAVSAAGIHACQTPADAESHAPCTVTFEARTRMFLAPYHLVCCNNHCVS